jgi:hypothetical protein
MFFNKITEKFLFFKIRFFLEDDNLTLYYLSMTCNLNYKYMKKILYYKMNFYNNITKIHNELKSYILQSTDIGSTILYRIQGMPRLVDMHGRYVND